MHQKLSPQEPGQQDVRPERAERPLSPAEWVLVAATVAAFAAAAFATWGAGPLSLG